MGTGGPAGGESDREGEDERRYQFHGDLLSKLAFNAAPRRRFASFLVEA